MFGKVSDKTKRDAYLTALSEERDSFVDKNSSQAAPVNTSAKNSGGREIVSGKEAIKLANKDLNIMGTYDKNAIKDDNKIVNMRYYNNWRNRLAEIEKDNYVAAKNTPIETKPSFNLNDNGSTNPVKPSYAGDEFGREPGLLGDDTTLLPEKKKFTSSKDLLDSLYSSNTKEEDDNTSILDRLFKNHENRLDASEQRPSFLNKRFASSYRDSAIEQETPKKDMGYSSSINSSDYNIEPDEDYTIDDFEDDLDEDDSYSDITKASTKVNSNIIEDDEDDDLDDDYLLEEEPPKPQKIEIKKPVAQKPVAPKQRKKKKKYDADIIGASGFFTA